MFEKETGNIIESIIRQFPPESYPYVSIKQILAAEIPEPIKIYLRAEIQSLLNNELTQLRHSSKFDFKHPEIQNYQNQINSILVLNYKYYRNDFQKRIDEAVHLMINYLIRPQWTLYNYLFENEKSLHTNLLSEILIRFGPYEYLTSILNRYIQERKIDILTGEQFKSIIWKIDSEYVKRKSGDDFSNILIQVFDFFDFGNSSNYRLPIKGIIKFLEDKGLTSVIPRFEGEIAQGRTIVNRQEFKEIINDIHSTLGYFIPEKIEFDHKDLIEKNIEQCGDSPKTNPDPQINRNLTLAIEGSDKRKFIKKIFLHKEDEFNRAIESIGRQNNWKQASKIIDEIFIQNNIDPYSSEARRFLELLFEQFHPNK